MGRRCRFRGIDNAAYYRLAEDRASTSTTPAPATRSTSHQPQVLHLIMD